MFKNILLLLKYIPNTFNIKKYWAVFICLIFTTTYAYTQESANQSIVTFKEKNQLERNIFNAPQQNEPKAQKLDRITNSNTRYTNNYCVRLCDGFFFPVVTLKNTSDDKVLQEEICASFCPGTPTAFYRSYGSINSAVNANYTPYVRLETAFAYRKKISNSCSCKTTTALGLNNLKYSHDFTLRKGDILNQEAAPIMFIGASHFPYKRDNFENVTKNSKIPKLTHEFFEQLKSNDTYLMQRLIYDDKKQYANLPKKGITDAQSDMLAMRKVGAERTARHKAQTFKEFLEMRQKSIADLDSQHANQN
jgi:Protein of unknown function (DUF2865)